LVKDKKSLLKGAAGTNLTYVKNLIDMGIDPNEMFGSDNAYTRALGAQVWYLSFVEEKNNYDEQKANLEIVKYLTPMIKSISPDDDLERTYIYRMLFGIANSKDTGKYDELIKVMIENGYKIKEDKGVFKVIGFLGLEIAKEILKITGPDDGDSVYSAAHNSNFDVLNYLLDQKIPVNKPFNYSSGGKNYALHDIISTGDISLVKRLLDAGADISLKNNFNQDCLEWAEDKKEILELLNRK
jgi:ankyrin repeat protein